MSDTPPSGARLIKREPVVLAVAPTYRDTLVFPSGAVDEVRPRRSEPVWTVVLTLLLGLGLLTSTVRTATWQPGSAVIAVGLGVVLLAGALAYGRAHPVTYAIGAAAAVGGLVTIGGPRGGIGFCALVGALSWPAWIGYRSRQRWWPRLEALLTEHQRVEGRVVHHATVGSDWRRVRVMVTSPAFEGWTWWVSLTQSTEAHLAVGDPVTIWYRPADPAAAVLCVSTDTVGLAAHLGRPPVPHDGD